MAPARSHLHLAILCCVAVSLLVAAFHSRVSAAADDETEWTIMVYMAADSEPALPWEEDINEMEGAGLADWMNVIVLVDPLDTGDSMILEVASDDVVDLEIVSPEIDDSLDVIPADGEVDTASPDTLTDFVTFCARSYPADRLALVLWGHSGGWYGLCQDGDALLRLPDLGLALAGATDELGRRLDMVIADTCVEGVVETMYEVREHADWYVGSEISVPAQGLRYDQVLDNLAEDSSITPEEWGGTICEIHRMTLLLNSLSSAMSVTDLRALDSYVDRLGGLSSYMQGYADLYRSDFLEALEQAAASDFMEWYLDAGDALRKLAGAGLPIEVKVQAMDALLAYDEMVYRFEGWASPFDENYDDMVNCTGVAIYAPSSEDIGPTYDSILFRDIGWANATVAIKTDEPETPNGAEPALSYADTDDEADEAILHWPAAHERLVAWVFARTDAGLELLDVVESSGTALVISGFAGELLVSASAWDSGVVVAHHERNLTLTRELDMRVTVVSEDGPVTDGIEVVVRTKGAAIYLDPSGDEFTGSLTVPGDADYGDLLTVEVLGAGGDKVAENRTYVTGSEMVLEIRYLTEPGDPIGAEFLIPIAGLLITAVAVFFYLRARRNAPEG